ncbi:rod shape-determining protein MreC [Nitrosomonas sp. Nm132]|uniref:rod shape-determining protein MreC n=1 Tax=Nitrosomonas sp. Nm132 TaxID=1881053 RepID=UPI0008860747|nr:rod shape-determining protein MreC [Nitrosomonas sp. Nm132]SDH54793.1 rod shape-determining protein MreC [Nitrosomonas sp. Nm132]
METVPQFFRAGPSPQVRLFFFVLLSILLMVMDTRFNSFSEIRQTVGMIIYPLQRLAHIPTALYDQAGELINDFRLTKEIASLRQQYFFNQQKLFRLQMLEEENAQLRALLGAARQTEAKAIMAEILYVPRDPFNRKVTLNKGSFSEIEAGQVVVDNLGVIGQITQVHPWLSEVTLITDKDHAVPVQVARNGLRSIVSGAGKNNELELRYLSVNADIQKGDLLITSGIGGVYPPGLPVARVENIEHDRSRGFAHIKCTPIAGVNRSRQVLILSLSSPAPKQPEEEPRSAAPQEKQRRSRVQ